MAAKNHGIILPDADLETAVEQVTIGATTYNGQRCTAIKLVFVPESIKDKFVPALLSKISSLVPGLPWEANVSITPLPEPNKPAYLQELIKDSIEKGASVLNADCGGGEMSGALMRPAVVYPVTADMRLW